MADSYWWITFRSTAADLELDQDRLFELGATGIEEPEDPGASGETPLLKVYFEESGAFTTAATAFRDRPGFASGEAPIEDWDRSWRDRQTPVEVTPSLTVVPPWVDPGSARHVIRLEAKMAFGTGSHESTRIAALLLENLPGPARPDGTGTGLDGTGAGTGRPSNPGNPSSPGPESLPRVDTPLGTPLDGRSVLDIGAGTGILALYAGLLGAGLIVALDIDPVTGPCLRENQALNPLPARARFQPFVGELGALREDAAFDIVICNMIRTELWPFREELRRRLKPGGHFIVSGQRQEDKPYFLAWQRQSPFRIVAEQSLDAWWGFAAQRLF